MERWTLLHDDLEARLVAVRQTRPGLPLVLYGHSLGGLVACGYVLSGHDRPLPGRARALGAGPGRQPGALEAVRWRRKARADRARAWPIPNGLPTGGLSRDPAVEAKAAADPLCGTKSTVRFGAEAFAEQDRLHGVLAGLDAMPVPTYVFHGSADPIVPVGASAVFEGMSNVTRVVHDGLRHECHHEPEHEAVLAGVVDWLRETLPGAPEVEAPAAAV